MESNVGDFFHQFQNMMNSQSSSSNMNVEESQVMDSVEVLSFSLLLHGYMGFYLYLFQQPLLAMMIYQAFACGISYSLFQYNFFSFLFHPFFRKHHQSIVLPQMLYALFHYYILFQNYPFYITIFLNMLMYQLSNTYFEKVEHQESKKIRTFMNLFIYFVKFFYLKMIYWYGSLSS